MDSSDRRLPLLTKVWCSYGAGVPFLHGMSVLLGSPVAGILSTLAVSSVFAAAFVIMDRLGEQQVIESSDR